MDLLVAYKEDPAGYNMAKFLAKDMTKDGDMYHGAFFDLLVISSPSISADWLEEKYNYDSYVFLSKHAAESGVLALTCHSTGNFSDAKFGGNSKQVAIPYPSLQKKYLQGLLAKKEKFSDFEITIEATHHGPSDLNKPCLFIEIGTTSNQWNDEDLCNSVAQIVLQTMQSKLEPVPYAICIGGTHYSSKFNNEILYGKFGLGTVIPKHALDYLDQDMFDHILQRNSSATVILLDWSGLGSHKQRIMEMVNNTKLEVIKL